MSSINNDQHHEEEEEEIDSLGALPVVQSLSAQAKERKRKTLREKKLEAIILKQRDQIARLVAALDKTNDFIHDYNVKYGKPSEEADAEAAVALAGDAVVEGVVEAADTVEETPVASTSILTTEETVKNIQSTSNSPAKDEAPAEEEEDDIVGALPTRRTIQAAITKRGSKADKAKERRVAVLESTVQAVTHGIEFQRTMHEHYKLLFKDEEERKSGWKKRAEELQRKLDEYEQREREEVGTQTTEGENGRLGGEEEGEGEDVVRALRW